MNQTKHQMWLELAPHRGGSPNRLLIFLHGAGSNPETFAPLATAWQYKFSGATAIVMQGLVPGATGYGTDWYEAGGSRDAQADRVQLAVKEVTRRIQTIQRTTNLQASDTALIGFSQGAVLALEIGRQAQPPANIVVAHAGRLLRPVTPGQTILPNVHLLHGELDSLVLAQHSVRAFRALSDAGANVSLDIVADGVHSIGQDMVNVGTTRMMQTLYAHRKKIRVDQYRALLTVSTDNQRPADPAGHLH